MDGVPRQDVLDEQRQNGPSSSNVARLKQIFETGSPGVEPNAKDRLRKVVHGGVKGLDDCALMRHAGAEFLRPDALPDANQTNRYLARDRPASREASKRKIAEILRSRAHARFQDLKRGQVLNGTFQSTGQPDAKRQSVVQRNRPMPSPKCRPMPSPKCKPMPSPKCRPMPSPKCGPMPSPKCGPMPSPKCEAVKRTLDSGFREANHDLHVPENSPISRATPPAIRDRRSRFFTAEDIESLDELLNALPGKSTPVLSPETLTRNFHELKLSRVDDRQDKNAECRRYANREFIGSNSHSSEQTEYGNFCDFASSSPSALIPIDRAFSDDLTFNFHTPNSERIYTNCTHTDPMGRICSQGTSSSLTSGVSCNGEHEDLSPQEVYANVQTADYIGSPLDDFCSDVYMDLFSSFDYSEFDRSDTSYLHANCQDIIEEPHTTTPQLTSVVKERQGVNSGKVKLIIDELISTETTYVQTLHLIDQEFQQVLLQRNEKDDLIPEEAVPVIFSNVSSLYKFHKDHLLKQLLTCSVPTASTELNRVGFIFKSLAPFLKLYTVYLCKFTEANKAFEIWKRKSAKFKKFVCEIENKPICKCLSLQHHMLGPVQRMPRYELLLKDYIQHLPENSPDKADAETALQLVTKAARHSNDVMKSMEQYTKLYEISRSVSGGDDIVSQQRHLLKEGKMIIISKRTGEQKERYFYLFNDVLLICKTTLGLNLKQQMKETAKLDINELQILRGNSETNTFYIRSLNHVVEVCPRSCALVLLKMQEEKLQQDKIHHDLWDRESVKQSSKYDIFVIDMHSTRTRLKS